MVDKVVIDEPPRVVVLPQKLTAGEKPQVTASRSLKKRR